MATIIALRISTDSFVGNVPDVFVCGFFSDFVKLERLAVRKSFRRSALAFDLVRTGINFARRKGFTRIYGHSREGLDDFWARFGAKPLSDWEKFVFSDYRYTEMVLDLEPIVDPISLKSELCVRKATGIDLEFWNFRACACLASRLKFL